MVRLLALLLACAPVLAAERIERQVGEAVDLRRSQPLYLEEHWVRYEADEAVERKVLYRCPSGEIFARKQVDYRGSDLAPDFELVDARFGYREGLRRDATGLEVFVRRETGQDERRTRLADAERLVADAGFDRFIHRHWDSLGDGRAVDLDFLVPSRQSAMGFRVRMAERRTIDGSDARIIRLSLGGMLGLFAPSIDVAYAEADRRLLRFEGLSNIRLDSGRNATVRIDFPEPPQPASARAWDELLDRPLAECSLGG